MKLYTISFIILGWSFLFLFGVPTKNVKRGHLHLKFMFSKKVIKIDEIFIVDLMLCSKSTVKILSIFVAFLENVNFTLLLYTFFGPHLTLIGMSYESKKNAHL